MPTYALVSTEEFEALKREVAALRAVLMAYVVSNPEWLRTDEAARVAGIRRETLVKYARATAPSTTQPGRITYRKDGRRSFYLKASCIDYAQRKLGLPSLT